MKISLFFALSLSAITVAHAQPERLGALPRGGRLVLDGGQLRALDARGQKLWQLARRDAKIAGDSDAVGPFYNRSVVLSNDKKLIAVRGDEAAQIRDSATGKVRFTARLYRATPLSNAQTKARFQNVDWSLRPVTLPGPGIFVTGMAFSPDGRHFALSGWQNTEINNGNSSYGTIIYAGRVRVFTVANGQTARDFDIKKAHMSSVRWTSNSRLLAVGGDLKKRVYSLR